MRQWWAPIGIIWLQWLLSAYVLERKIPQELREQVPSVLTGALIALPLTSVLILSILRRIDRRGDGHSMTLWTITFLFTVHVLVLSVVVGILPTLHSPLVLATGGWLIGMGVLLGRLPVESPMGYPLENG